MMRRSALTLACFLALAATTAAIVGRVAQPHVTGLLVVTAALATFAGAAGLAYRRGWVAAVALLPLGAYVLARLEIPLPYGAGALQAQAVFYAHQLTAGAGVYVRELFPLNGTSAGLRLLLSLSFYGSTWLAALLALSFRRPLPAVVVLLLVAGFGFTTDETARTPLPAVAFVVLAGGLLAASRPRAAARVKLAGAVTGGLTATLAALLALSILGVTAVGASRPLKDWRAWRVSSPNAAVFDFGWMQNYPGLLAKPDNAVVMKVSSPVPSYWRANVLSRFTGTAWLSALSASALQGVQDGGSWRYAAPPLPRDPAGRVVTERFTVQNSYTDHLFVGGVPLGLTTSLPLDLSVSSAGAVAVDPARGPGVSYSVSAFVPALAPGDLAGRGRAYPARETAAYLQLPFAPAAQFTGPGAERRWRAWVAARPDGSQWSGLYALNRRIVGGRTDPYAIARAIEAYLRGGYVYSLRPPPASDPSPYAAFLFQTHTGYCQHFAGAMALLLRYNGIPARVAVGFKEGRLDKQGVYVVRRSDSHAWVEAYFPGVGWAPFDPTPGNQLPSTAGVSATGTATGPAPWARPGASSPLPPATFGGGRQRVRDPGGVAVTQPAAVTSGGGTLWLIALIALPAWPAGRALLRRRGLLRSSAEERVRVSAGLIYATLRDHGVAVPASQTLDETARLLRDRYGIDASAVAARVQAILFGGRPAGEQDLRDLRRLRRRLRATLRARSGWLRSVGAAYGLHAAPGPAG